MTQLTNVFQDNVDYPDLLCLQEVGGLKGIEHVQGIPFSLGKQSYIAYALDTKESWRGVCLAVRHELTTAVEYTQAHPFGVLAKLAMHGVHWYFASLHFPCFGLCCKLSFNLFNFGGDKAHPAKERQASRDLE